MIEEYEKKFMSHEESSVSPRERFEKGVIRRIGKVGASGLAIVAVGALAFGNGELKSNEEKTEACVSELVGRDVDLVRHPESDALQRPAEAIREMAACGRAGNNPQEARALLDLPFGS